MDLRKRVEQAKAMGEQAKAMGERAVQARAASAGGAPASPDAGDAPTTPLAGPTSDESDPGSIERLVLVFVRRSRPSIDERPVSRAAIRDRRVTRQRVAKVIARSPIGAAAKATADLYTEGQILCEVEALNDLGLTDDELSARLMVHWGILPDVDRAMAAVRGEPGQSVVDALRGRMEFVSGAKRPSKMELLKLVLELRSMRKSRPWRSGSQLDEMIADAEATLGVAGPLAR